jgi:hypothetical protein
MTTWHWILLVEGIFSLLVGLGYVSVSSPSDQETADSFADRLLFATLSVFLIFCAADALILLPRYLKIAILWGMNKFGVQAMQLLIAGIVLLFGWLAFLFKQKDQRSYGLVEVFFAAIAGVITARQIKFGADWSGQAAALVGVIYIVSRGLNNVRDGTNVLRQREKARRDEIERKRAETAAQIKEVYLPAVRYEP